MKGKWEPHEEYENGKRRWIAARKLDESRPWTSSNMETRGRPSERIGCVMDLCDLLNGGRSDPMTEAERKEMLKKALWEAVDVWEDDELTDEEKCISVYEIMETALTKANAARRRRRA